MASFWNNLTGKNTENTWNEQKSNIQNANSNYNDTASQYTGNAGYSNSLQQAQKGANATAQNAAQQAQTSARNSGMSKAQQAAMGANTTANTYANNYANQQSEAANQGNNAVNAAQTNVSNVNNLANTDLGVQNTQTQNAKTNLNYLTTTAEGIGNILQPFFASSDERVKDSVDITNQDPAKAEEAEQKEKGKQIGKAIGGTVASLAGKAIGNAIQPGVGGTVGGEIGKLAGGKIGGDVGSFVSSDERCKDYESLEAKEVADNTPQHKTISDYIADLGTYLYKYKDEAQEAMPGLTDDRKHVGVFAQELQTNPATQGTVVEMPNGTLAVDTKQLSLTNTQNIADLARRLDAVERRLNDYDTNKAIKGDKE